MDGGIPPPGRGKIHNLVYVLDLNFSSFVVAPLVIAFWSSTWSILSTILSLFLFTKNNDLVCASLTIGFGSVISFVFTRYQKQLQTIFTQYIGNKFLYFLGSRLYTEIFGFANVSTWYGSWIAIDFLTGPQTTTIISVVIVSYLTLTLTRSSRNLKSTPFIIALDSKEEYFSAPTLLRSLSHKKEDKLLLDLVLSVFIVNTLVCLVWRGSWFLLDEILYMQDKQSSNFLSLIIGYFVVFFTFLTQSLIRHIAQETTGWKRLIIVDMHGLFTFFGTMNIWRGVWNTLTVLTDLDNSLNTAIIVHVTSICLLIMLKTANTVLLRGACLETEENMDECIEFPRYFSLKYKGPRGRSNTMETDESEPNDRSENLWGVSSSDDLDTTEIICLQELNST